MRYALALMVVSALAATAGLARGESPRAPELVYASVRLLNEEGGPRVDQVADLFALRVNGTGLRRLTRTVDWEDAPAWSHDGSRIAYGRGLPACHANTCDGALEASIWLANGDGSRPRRLSNGLARRLLDGSPAWSPDDRQVAFTRKHCCDTSPEDGVYVVSSAGSGLRRLVTMRAEAVDWAPDGRRLAVAAHRGAPVLLVDVSTGEVTPLSVVGLPSPVSDVAWAPNGKRLVAATKRGVFVVSSTGGRARRLSGALPVGNVAWSPDGGRLAFSSRRTAPGQRSDVYVMASDGTALASISLPAGARERQLHVPYPLIMFTGLVREVGEVASFEGGRLVVAAATEGRPGDSIAVDGVCLTVVENGDGRLAFDVVPETLDRVKPFRGRVNLEPALRAGEPLGGHYVQGHVDGVGTVTAVEPERDGRRIRIEPPADLLRYVVEKGSIAVEGVSLTVAALDDTGFEIALIPHTLSGTTLSDLKRGDRVNLEADVLAKYVERLLAR